MRNELPVIGKPEVESADGISRVPQAIPHSALRIPHWGMPCGR
jgi:hypothetical protein